MYFAKLGGMEGAVADLSMRPSLPTSHYSRHVKKVTGMDGEFEYLDNVPMPSTDSNGGTRAIHQLPCFPAHESLNREIAEHPELHEQHAEAVAAKRLPKSYMNHPVAQSSGYKALPVVFHLDGVPTFKHDSVVGLWFNFLLSPRRHCVAVI